jgi:hypothetical protein
VDRRRFLIGSGLALIGGAEMLRRDTMLPPPHASGSEAHRVPRYFGSPAPTTLAAFALTTAAAGGWSWFGDPRAVYYNGKTYFGYIRGDNGNVCIRSYDHVTEIVSAETVLHAALEIDDHDVPSIHVRPSDGRIVVWYSAHLGPAIYQRISTNPEDISAFGSETDLDASFGGSQYTYPSPVYTSSGTTIWLFVRSHVAGIAYWWYNASGNGGATWGSTTQLHSVTYSKIASNGTDRIDVACSNHPDAGATKIYHLYRQSAAWHKSDGTNMGTGIPFAGTDMTTVYDGGAKLVWIWDIAYKSDGNPVIVFVKFESTTDHRYMYADWDGSTWTVTEIVAGGSYIATDLGFNASQVYYSGGVVLDHSDPTIVWASVGVGGGVWEIRRLVTANAGASFSSSTLVSSGKNMRPVSVRNHVPGLQALYMPGTYASYVTYSVGTSGVGL